jgi:hypothetical protein
LLVVEEDQENTGVEEVQEDTLIKQAERSPSQLIKLLLEEGEQVRLRPLMIMGMIQLLQLH